MTKLEHDVNVRTLAKNNSTLRWVTTAMAVACVVLIFSNIANANRERIILTPPEINKTFWVERSRASAEYLEQMAHYYVGLALNLDPSSVDHNADLFLNATDPAQRGAIKASLKFHGLRVKNKSVSQVFYPSGGYRIDPQNLVVVVDGELVTIIGETPVMRQKNMYRIKFGLVNSRMVVTEFDQVADPNKPFQQPEPPQRAANIDGTGGGEMIEIPGEVMSSQGDSPAALPAKASTMELNSEATKPN